MGKGTGRACPGGCTYDFSHPNGQKLVVGPHLAAREAKKCSLYPGGENSNRYAAESITFLIHTWSHLTFPTNNVDRVGKAGMTVPILWMRGS